MTSLPVINQLQQNIINNVQKGFPLVARPYQSIANMLAGEKNDGEFSDITETSIFNAIEALNSKGIISRIGPVFDHKKAGASTLAALAVPTDELDKVAGIVNQFEQVNHNYGRESYAQKENYNLWFVVTASDMVALKSTLTNIELQTGLPVLILPMEASYHIDLAFSINITGQESPVITKTDNIEQEHFLGDPKLSAAEQNNLRKAIEKGLPLALNPYLVIAQSLGILEVQVLTQIAQWQHEGLIRRFGLVVKHRKLGYDANAMVVWNIKNTDIDNIAPKLAKCAAVSLCYQRPRRFPDWPYNLFCMIHGTDRAVVIQQIHDITEQLQLQHINKDILFSFKAYKQHGARYLQKRQKSPLTKLKQG